MRAKRAEKFEDENKKIKRDFSKLLLDNVGEKSHKFQKINNCSILLIVVGLFQGCFMCN